MEFNISKDWCIKIASIEDEVDPTMSDLWQKRRINEVLETLNLNKGALNYDEGKARFDLIPPEVLFALGEILAQGEKKYTEPRNWEKGMEWSRNFASLQRHLWAWWGRKDKDTESGSPHLYHALARIVFLLVYEQRQIGKDDRPKSCYLL